MHLSATPAAPSTNMTSEGMTAPDAADDMLRHTLARAFGMLLQCFKFTGFDHMNRKHSFCHSFGIRLAFAGIR